MKSRPILFKDDMVRAILEGRKTQTRRVVKLPRNHAWGNFFDGQICPENDLSSLGFSVDELRCPYGKPGDQLWVREAWQGPILDSEEHEAQCREDGPEAFKKPGFCVYRATDLLDAIDFDGNEIGWRPSIHMPRWASRITLEITSVRVERLQDISEADAKAEGVEGHYVEDGWYWRNYLLTEEDAAISPMLNCPKESFRSLWQSINGLSSWNTNPWVWVMEFKRAKP
ncbi:MAG: hypothetical protein U1D69_03005 [Polynucleobacter sp.]|nr:hypothetical protein [Polynucleobacter sp.]